MFSKKEIAGLIGCVAIAAIISDIITRQRFKIKNIFRID